MCYLSNRAYCVIITKKNIYCYSSNPTIIKEIYFKHASLRKIKWKPTYDDLQKLYRQARANTKSVPSTLGYGANGYLGLIIDAVSHQKISPVNPFIRSVHPGALPAQAGVTGPVIAACLRVPNAAISLIQE